MTSVAIIGIALLGALTQSWRLPDILSGFGLAYVAGSAPDPHLFTAALSAAIFRHCTASAPCVHQWNAYAFAVVLGLLSLLWIGRTGASLLSMAIAGLFLATSPLAISGVVDAGGIGFSLSWLLVGLACADIVGLRTLSLPFACAIAGALALQDPLLAPAALVYAIARRPPPSALADASAPACVVLAVAARLMLRNPSLASLHVDAIAAPLTLVALGATIFGLGPLAIYSSRRFAWHQHLLDTRASIALAIGIVAFAGGTLAPAGDPTPYWFCVEIALVFAAVPFLKLSFSRRYLWAAVTAVAIVVQCGVFLAFHGENVAVAVAAQSKILDDALQNAGPLCLAIDDSGMEHVLGEGAFIETYAPKRALVLTASVDACAARAMPSARLVAVTGGDVTDWGRALPLVKAYHAAEHSAVPVGSTDGDVSPKTHALTPTKTGAFRNVLPTPLGPLPDFVVLSGYSYAFRCIAVSAGARLSFAVETFPGTAALTFAVETKDTSGEHAVARGSVPQVDAAAVSSWQFVTVPVRESVCAAFTFRVREPHGQTGAWMTFAGASIQ